MWRVVTGGKSLPVNSHRRQLHQCRSHCRRRRRQHSRHCHCCCCRRHHRSHRHFCYALSKFRYIDSLIPVIKKCRCKFRFNQAVFWLVDNRLVDSHTISRASQPHLIYKWLLSVVNHSTLKPPIKTANYVTSSCRLCYPTSTNYGRIDPFN